MAMLTTLEPQTVTLPPLHKGQHEARRALDAHRYLVLLTGRQWGKSRLCAVVALAYALLGKRVWWISPSHQLSEDAWRTLCRFARDIPGARVTLSLRTIRFPSGGEVRVRSAVDPDSLRGGTLDLAILDEAAYMPERVWTEIVRPMLAVRGGKAIFASTPAGHNWFYSLYMRGQSGGGDWVSLRYRSVDSPFFSAAEWTEAQKSPMFEQEYNASPSAGDSGVIPLAWVTDAVERWKVWKASGEPATGDMFLGIDVSEGGGDATIFAHRIGQIVTKLTDHTPRTRGDMMPISDDAIAILKAHDGKSYAIVDSVGSGAMLPGLLRREGCGVISFKAGAGTNLRDASHEFGFNNLRSAAWWNMREVLNPEHSAVCLPDDHGLIQELTAPQYRTVAGNRIAIESKDDLKKPNRLGRSTDKADAVVQSFWTRTIIR